DLASRDVVADLSTSQEAIVSNNDITIEGGSLEEVKEATGVEDGLLEVNVQFCALRVLVRKELSQNLSLETLSDGIIELNFRVKSIEGGPGLGEGKAYS